MASRLHALLPLLCATALVLAGLPFARPTQATSNVVTNNGDFVGATCPGPTCTLRAAIDAATSPGDVITFQPGLASPITLTQGELGINSNSNLTIQGPGPAALAVHAAPANRVFNIGQIIEAGVTISGLTIQNGSAPQGGGILVHLISSRLMLSNATVTGNTATGTAGVAQGAGGGIDNRGTAILTNVTISQNTALGVRIGSVPVGGFGGGIHNTSQATLTLTNVTVHTNSTGAGSGAGLDGGGFGGGILNEGGTATLTNVTVSTNTAAGNPSATGIGGGSGGGLANAAGSGGAIGFMTLTNSTVNANTAGAGGAGASQPGSGGGIFSAGGNPVMLKNTIVENSTGSSTNCSGPPFFSQGSNLMGDTSCGFNGALGDLVNPTPLLGPLQLNPPNPPVATPGNDLTHALLPGSPAIDAVSAANCAGLTTDERNVSRPQGPSCDIGAFELQPSVTPTATATATPTATPTPARIPGDFNGDGFVDIRDYGVWRQNFGQTNCGNPADADGNCLVDIRDYGIWRQHFGEGTPPDRRSSPVRADTAPAPRGTPGPALLGSAPAAAVPGSPLRTDDSGPAVPVIPLVGGLLGLGGLAGWRARRPGRDE